MTFGKEMNKTFSLFYAGFFLFCEWEVRPHFQLNSINLHFDKRIFCFMLCGGTNDIFLTAQRISNSFFLSKERSDLCLKLLTQSELLKCWEQ